MRNFVNINHLSKDEISALIDKALWYKHNDVYKSANNKVAALMFLEDSTRTKASFEMALLRSGMRFLDLKAQNSSLNKGESFYDTCKTYEMIGVNALIIRSGENEFYKQLTDLSLSIINAGDGNANHPSQNLLDAMSIYEHFGRFDGLNIGICGDIKNSRVANSCIRLYENLGAKLSVIAPKYFENELTTHNDLDEVLPDLDVLMMLRIQHERHIDCQFSLDEYIKGFCLSQKRANKLKNNALIMHPAPVNWGVEIEALVRENPRCVIFKQMQNGVFARMSILDYAIGE